MAHTQSITCPSNLVKIGFAGSWQACPPKVAGNLDDLHILAAAACLLYHVPVDGGAAAAKTVVVAHLAVASARVVHANSTHLLSHNRLSISFSLVCCCPGTASGS